MFPGFFNFTDRMNFLQLCLFFIACFLIYILLGVYSIGWVWSRESREKKNDVVNGFTGVLGLIFAVLVGSVIVTAWQYQDRADTDSSKEADAVGDLYQMAPNLGERESIYVKSRLRDYAKNVIEVEWPLMRKTIKPTSGWSYLFEIRSTIANYTPPSTKNSILLNNMEKKFNELLDARRQRIQSSLYSIPFVIYILLFFVSAFIIFFNMFLGLPYWLHVMFLSCLSIPISLCIVVIIALDLPFRTQIRINPDEMQRVLKLLKD